MSPRLVSVSVHGAVQSRRPVRTVVMAHASMTKADGKAGDLITDSFRRLNIKVGVIAPDAASPERRVPASEDSATRGQWVCDGPACHSHERLRWRLQRSRLRRRSCGVELASQPGLSRVLHSLLQRAALRCEDPTHRKAALVQQIGQGGVLGGILLDGLRIEIDNPQRKGE